MNMFAQLALFLWLPIVVGIFVALPPRRALIASYIIAWLALPSIGFELRGLPNYTKMTATAAGIVLCMAVFHQSKLFSFRPRWYDLPMVVWCACPFFTALANDLGAYEGASATLDPVVAWGIPYFIGRIYLTNLEDLRELALCFVIGGLVYLPLCLLELRLSSHVCSLWVYGIFSFEHFRFGASRPKVFLQTGLELGLWMCNATLVCLQLWASKTVEQIRGVSIGKLSIALLVTTVLCRSSGALVEMLVGLVALWTCLMFKKSWPVWLLLLIPPMYTTTRAFNVWSGQEAVDLATMTLGADRGQSLEFRLTNENMLAGRARESLILGWGRFNRSAVVDKAGNVLSTPDGYWIITLGITGLVGLTSLELVMILPMALTLLRFPVRTWKDPLIMPVVTLSMVVLLQMIDFLSNAMLNPIYALAIGGVIGQSAVRPGVSRREGEECLAVASDLAAEGRAAEAGEEFRRAAEFASRLDDEDSRRVQAEALDGLGHSLMSTGHTEEAEVAFRDALIVRDWLVARFADSNRFRDLAIARESLSRALAEIGRSAGAIEERRIALQIWDILVANHPRDLDYRAHRLDALNDLAWLLTTDPDPTLHDPAWALHMAEQSVGSQPDHLASWNTLGVARYRAGDWTGAIEALERSALSSVDHKGTAFDHFFMAMAWCRLQHDDRAREWLEQGIAWASRHRPDHPALERFRKEAESLLVSEHGRSSLDPT